MSDRTTVVPRFLVMAATGMAASLVLALLLIAVDRDKVQGESEMSHIELGVPVNWLQQDQSGLDPPAFPRNVGLASPLENETTVSWLRLGSSIGFIWLLLALIYLVTSHGTASAKAERASEARQPGSDPAGLAD